MNLKFYAIVVLSLFGLTGCMNNPTPKPVQLPNKCEWQQTITETTAIPSWQTYNTIPAVTIADELYDPIAAGSPFLWYDANKSAVLLDDRYFTDFTTVDATNVSAEPIVITTVSPEIYTVMTPRELVIALIETHLIRTYAQLEADVCLTAQEETKAGANVFHFSAVHRYCTNDCYEKEYSFRVIIAATGKISVGL